MKKVIWWLIGIIVIVIIIALSAKTPGNKSVTIGGVFPLTGPVAIYGEYLKEGSELAIDDAIKSGLIKKGDVTFVMEDSVGDPAKGIAAFQKILNSNNLVAVLPALSGVTLAIKPIGNEKHIVMINGSAISTDIEDANDYMFSVLPNANTEGSFLAELAYGQGKRHMGILFRNDASGKSFDSAFKNKFTELGGSIVYEDSHMPNATDFRSYITKIASVKDLDGVFVASYGPEVATYLKQANELNLHRQTYGYTTSYSPKVLEIAGQAANGLTFSAPVFDANSSNDPIASEFKEKILTKYNSTDNNYYIASHYDAMTLLLTPLSRGNRTGESIRDYLAALKSYQGKTGLITFDQNGLGSIPLQAYTIKDGKFMKLGQ